MKRMLLILLCLLFVMPSVSQAVEPGFAVRHGSRDDMRIAITVDDCYNLACLQDILNLAAEHEIPMTFFVLGNMIHAEDRALWQSVVHGGHEIGNHSYGHPSLPLLEPRGVLQQLERTQTALDEALDFHYPMQMMRPPYGNIQRSNGSSISDLVEMAGYKRIVLWDVSQTDPSKTIHAVQPGSILLYHTNPKDYHCLVQLIPALKEKGFTFCTVSELLGYPAPVPEKE